MASAGRIAARIAPLLGAVALLGVPGTAAARAAPALKAASAPAAELHAADTVTLPGGAAVYRFQQRVGGRPVIGAQAVVDDGVGSPPRLVADSTRPAIRPPAAPRVTRAGAIGIATHSEAVTKLRTQPSASLAIEPGDGGTLVWRVVIPAARPLGDFEVLVDAASGEVVGHQNLLMRFRTGRAKLYDPNPVVEHGGVDGLRRDDHNDDTPLLTRLRRRVALPNIAAGQDCLRGRWVHAMRGRGKRETCNKHLKWGAVTRSNPRFDALMVYFHIDRAQVYLRSLGFSDAGTSRNGINDRTQRAVANAFRADNSFYSPATRMIMYGSGGVDDAQDADVILHEYGHAMQDSQSPAFARARGFQAGALAEGSSDYWAAAMSALSPHTANEDDVCIFDWDATTYGRFYPAVPPYTAGRFCGRRADFGRSLQKAKRLPACGSDIHCVGQVWSTALWNIRRSLVAADPVGGGARADQIYLASQFLYTGQESFPDAANALLCADENLHPVGSPGDCRGEDYGVLHSEMIRRGILQ